ncbi:hypothetical protein YK56LOC_31950 [Caballeronia sp. HLA56]
MTDSGVPIRCFTYTPGRGTRLADKLFTGIREGAVMMTDVYEHLPFAQASVFRFDRMGRRCISGLVAAGRTAAAPYEIR